MIGVLSAGNFVIGMGAFMVVGLLVPLAEDLEISAASAGLLMTVYAAAYAISAPLLVALTGRMPRRLLLLAAMAIFAASAFLASIAETERVLWFARCFAAFGGGIFTPVASAVAASNAPPEHRGKALAQVFLGLTFAQLIGVPLGGFVAYSFGWQAAFALVGMLALAHLIAIALVLPKDMMGPPASTLASLGAALMDVGCMLRILFAVILLSGVFALTTFFAPMFTQSMGFGRNEIALLLFTFGLGAVAGNLIGGFASDRIDSTRLLLGICIAMAALTPLYALIPMPMIAVLALTFVWSTIGWTFAAPQQMQLISYAPERANVMLALHGAAIYVGSALGSGLGALVLSRFDYDALGIVGAIMMLLAAGILMIARRY